MDETEIETLRASLTPAELESLAVARDRATRPIYSEAQLRDHAFFLANKADILLAVRENRIQREPRHVAAAPKPAAAQELTFSRSQLRDPAYFAEHKAEIIVAQREGRIVDDSPAWRTGRVKSTKGITE